MNLSASGAAGGTKSGPTAQAAMEMDRIAGTAHRHRTMAWLDLSVRSAPLMAHTERATSTPHAPSCASHHAPNWRPDAGAGFRVGEESPTVTLAQHICKNGQLPTPAPHTAATSSS